MQNSCVGKKLVSEAFMDLPSLARQARVKIVQEHLKIAQSRLKSFTNAHRRELEFQVRDKVFLKVSPNKGTLRFGQKGKLTRRYIGPFEIQIKGGGSLQTGFPTATIRSSRCVLRSPL